MIWQWYDETFDVILVFAGVGIFLILYWAWSLLRRYSGVGIE